MIGPGIYRYQLLKIPDVTDEFFSFLAKERDNPESSFVMMINGKSGTGKTVDAMSIAYTMLKTDPRRFVATNIGYLTIRRTGQEIDRRVRPITTINQVHESDIVILDEYPVSHLELSPEMYAGPTAPRNMCRSSAYDLARLVTVARHKRICVLAIVAGMEKNVLDKHAHIILTAISTGVAYIDSTYKGFFKRGIVHFSRSPLETEFHDVYKTNESLLLRPVIVCAHCLGIVRETDTKCGYCGYLFETTVLR